MHFVAKVCEKWAQFGHFLLYIASLNLLSQKY